MHKHKRGIGLLGALVLLTFKGVQYVFKMTAKGITALVNKLKKDPANASDTMQHIELKVEDISNLNPDIIEKDYSKLDEYSLENLKANSLHPETKEVDSELYKANYNKAIEELQNIIESEEYNEEISAEAQSKIEELRQHFIDNYMKIEEEQEEE